MRLDLVTNIDRFLELRDDWNRLLLKSGSMRLPLSHEWLFTWWQVFGGERQLNIICVYDEVRLIAIAPFLNEQSRYRGVAAKIRKFMANGHSPYCDLIIDGDISEDQKNEVLELITRSDSTDILQFNKIPEDSLIFRNITERGKNPRFRCGIKSSLVTPIIQVQGEWDEFFANKSRKFRRSLNNKLNGFKKSGDFTTTCEKITSSEHPYLVQMVEISKQSWKKGIKKDLGSNAAGRDFLFKLADKFGPTGNIDLWIVHKGDKPVAFEYHLEFGGVVYPIRADFSETFRSFSPGSVLEYMTLKNLFDEGEASEYHSCADNYWYLSNWSMESRRHAIIEVFANSCKAQFLYALEYRLIPKIRVFRDKLSQSKPSE